MNKKLLAITVCALALLFALFGCHKAPAVDYSIDNSYAVTVTDTDDALTYSPGGIEASVGLIFYVGTAISPQGYDYLGRALAAQGYLAVFPKADYNMTFVFYEEYEPAFYNYSGVKFFLGGHSQGGGTALRRAEENPDKVMGLVLLSPLCYTHDGGVFSGKTDPSVMKGYNVLGTGVPSLILEAEGDKVLTQRQRAAVTECVDEYASELHTIAPGAHMSFSTMDDDATLNMFNGDGDGITDEGKQAQREATIRYVLAFMKRVTLA